MKSLLSILVLLLATLIAYTQPANTVISNGFLFDGEPYIAVNPTNDQNLVSAWMGLEFVGGLHIGIKTRASFNGGDTWSSTVTLPHFGTDFGSADPSMAFDNTGLLYVCYIDYKQAPDSGGIYVARSLDGGLSWDAPSKAFDMYDVPIKRPIDRPWLVVDNSSTANAGTLYITTKPAPWITPPNRNYFKVSSDGGYTWSSIANVDGGTHLVGGVIAGPMAAPATTINGDFCAVFSSYVSTQNVLPAYYFAKSSNQGQTFSYTTVFATVPAASDENFKKGYQLITNPADGNEMIFLTPDAQNGDSDIAAFRSNNGGQTWSGPVRVNDDLLANGKAQDMVWGAYNETGDLTVTWRDRRNANTNGFWNADYDFYYATSTDNGQSFSANEKLSTQLVAFDSIISESGNDFMSCAYGGDTLYTVWGDTRSGKMKIYFAKTIASTNTNVGITLLDGNEPKWNIYPNPSTNEINITIPDALIGEKLMVYDEIGKLILERTLKDLSIQIETSAFARGIYFIKIGNEVMRFVR